MNNLDQMTIEAVLDEAGNPTVDMHTYLYVDTNGKMRAIRKVDHESTPHDEQHELGYAIRLLRMNGGTGRPWHQR